MSSGKSAPPAIASVATSQASAIAPRQRDTMHPIATSPRGQKLIHAADFVRIREWCALSARADLSRRKSGGIRCATPPYTTRSRSRRRSVVVISEDFVRATSAVGERRILATDFHQFDHNAI